MCINSITEFKISNLILVVLDIHFFFAAFSVFKKTSPSEFDIV